MYEAVMCEPFVYEAVMNSADVGEAVIYEAVP